MIHVQPQPVDRPATDLRPYDGKWVAYAPGGTAIIASDAELFDLDQTISAMGIDPESVLYERIELMDVSESGGAGL